MRRRQDSPGKFSAEVFSRTARAELSLPQTAHSRRPSSWFRARRSRVLSARSTGHSAAG